MEFLVEFEVEVPDGTPESEVDRRTRAESMAAAELAAEGHLLRVWRRAAVTDDSTVIGLYYFAFLIANAVVGYVGGLYSSLPTTTFWLIHVASAAFGLVAFIVFKMVIGHRMQSTPEDQAAALS